MVRFIFVCMAIVALSFVAIPLMGVYNGISGERAEVLGLNDVETAAGQAEDEITFEEIYSSADSLNDIETAAGDDSFTGGFQNRENPALADDVAEDDIEIEETPL